jgi:hypothetical protein
MSSQKYSSSSPYTSSSGASLLPSVSNILQPKRLNSNNVARNGGSTPSDPSFRRTLGSKGHLPVGISHLSNQQLTSLLSRSSLPQNLDTCQIASGFGGSAILGPTNINNTSSITVSTIGNDDGMTSTPTKKGPNNMAKRNARERNRVKQVWTIYILFPKAFLSGSQEI